MKNLSSRLSALLIFLLVLLLTAQSLASGYVFCIAEGGHEHVAFEHSTVDRCAPSEAECPTAKQECSRDLCHDHCGSCRHFSTSSDSLQSRSRSDHDLAAPAPVPAFAAEPARTSTIFVRDLTTNLSPLPPPQPRTSLLALRTVVLLN